MEARAAQDAVGPSGPPSVEERLSDPVYLAWVSEPAVAVCVQCHLDGAGLAAAAGAAGGTPAAFSRRQEMENWVSRDKHAIARRRVEPFTPEQLEAELLGLITQIDATAGRIADVYEAAGFQIDRAAIGLRSVPTEWVGPSNLLSRQICDKLWGPGRIADPAVYAKFESNCLTCHGGVTPESDRWRAASRSRAATDDTTGIGDAAVSKTMIGIDCLYCHQSGDASDWVLEHLNAPRWRNAPPAAKASRGMRDLVNVTEQASLCLDCHVGNRDRGMFVSHRMYAAGHPPLPSIEIETFCDQMPRHWQTASDLYDHLPAGADRETYFAVNYPNITADAATDPAETHWDARSMVLSVLATRRRVAELMVQSVRDEQWGDYALYDCAACHHELDRDSRRQRRYADATPHRTPGRPREHEWPAVLLDGAYAIGGASLYRDAVEHERRLADAFDETPFGDPARVSGCATELIGVIDTITRVAERRPFDAELSLALLRRIATVGADGLLTYDAGRQAVWAVGVLGDELDREGTPIPPDLRRELAALRDVERVGVESELPAGRDRFIYPDGLADDFTRRAAYDPDALVERLRGIAAAAP